MSAKRVVLLGPARDRLAAALALRLGRRACWIRHPGLQAWFAVDPAAPACDGAFVLDGEELPWADVSGLVVRPHAAWLPARRFADVKSAFTAHEHRAALCALTAAFPGVVANHLPPGWFLDRPLCGALLARDLAGALAVPFSGIGLRTRRRAWAWLAGERCFAATADGPDARAFARWLGADAAALRAWQRQHGARLLRVEGVADGNAWALRRVDLAPPAARLSDSELAGAVRALAEVLR